MSGGLIQRKKYQKNYKIKKIWKKNLIYIFYYFVKYYVK